MANILSSLGGVFTTGDWIILERLTLAVIIGAVIGFEREWLGRTAGLRTHALVCLGAALFTVISILVFGQFPSINGVAGYDQHIVANIIVGIGFIGGGAILRMGNRVQGVTTAASLWLSAAVGMALGFGFIKEGIFAVFLVYGIQLILRPIERKIKGRAIAEIKEENDDVDKENKAE